MQIRFLLGPAGTGKTFQCLAAIREELLAHPEGPPLIFLAPKQATFQLERQLLENGGLQGYTRLHILSFQRLARFVFEELNRPLPGLLGEEGRVMVLRSILSEAYESLASFRNSARRPGFAEELSGQIREFQNYGLTPAQLRKMAEDLVQERVRRKLQDLALLYELYLEWLGARDLQDGDALLELAADLLERAAPGEMPLAGLWFDGFAQLTPAERKLLLALLPCAQQSTLAFCLDSGGVQSAVSQWNLVQGTFNHVAREITGKFGIQPKTVELTRDPQNGRFAASSVLQNLEQFWGDARKAIDLPSDEVERALNLVECSDPEAEATFCAREIVKHVRAGGRYRETAVLLRHFENGYPDVFRRAFLRYGVPCFIDQREGVAHHPVAELTRGALRTLLFNWRMADWFCALKSGLVPLRPDELDALENETLARGWEGTTWEKGFRIRQDPETERRCNELREESTRAFFDLGRELGHKPTGREMRGALRAFWEQLLVREQLAQWATDENHNLHETVWEQMVQWLDNVALAFEEQRMTLREWLPIIEAGLSTLTVGHVPPVLDQVLIGTVDRSRNPDLKLLLLAGLNEGFFPAPPRQEQLLNERERELLAAAGCAVPSLSADHMAGEQFYGYIACTRARERLVMTFSQSSLEGTALNPSRFVGQMRRLFPNLQVGHWNGAPGAGEVLHLCELLPSLGAAADITQIFGHPLPEAVASFSERLAALRVADPEERLQPELAAALYKHELRASVSALEKFAACPFQFFVARGLRLNERRRFKLDVREQGAFQHQVLERFHLGLCQEKRRWRDLSVEEARTRIRQAAHELLPSFQEGLLCANEQNRFTAEAQAETLAHFITAVIGWFGSNHFDPEHVELPFGPDSQLPGWRIELDNGRALLLRGRIDRLDVWREGDRAYFIIMDYKSGRKQPDRTLLHHGIQQQLPAYLLAITQMEESQTLLSAREIVGAGVFFLPLRPRFENGDSRLEVLADRDEAQARGFMHHGIFDLGLIERLDANWRGDGSGQFKYSIRNDGSPYKGSFNALSREQFQRLLRRTEDLLREFGNRIYEGETAIRPFRHGGLNACEHCDFQPVCRFDSWSQPFNVLSAPPKEAE